MDIKDIKSLIKMVTETDITDFELESGGEKIKIQRGKSVETVQYVPQPMAMHQQLPMTAPVAAAELQKAMPPVSTEADTLRAIPSPIVGTIYHAPSPDSPSYVEIGQTVEKGQVLCIVEAMKLMNEIEADFRCKIVKICKENAQPVEYGETLFLVEPL
ncbi:MAG: acetyl-CoA carboxylase biotin carboxyl carrier protein [Deltaproteobacteria bacterium]|nr:acetyl-CoA carboxylase biotin carboxyl carrier protein [Deltaproteobacteria bacterium]